MSSKKRFQDLLRGPRDHRRRPRPGLTILEDRCTPSVAALLNGTTLDISITGGNDAAKLSISGTNVVVKDSTNTVVFKTAISSFDSIVATGDGGTSEGIQFNSTFNLNGTFATSSITDVILKSVLTVNGDADATIDGSFSGSGKFTKNGAGTLTLTGASNVFGGAVTVNSGSLLIGSSSSAEFDAQHNAVNANGTLDVFGTVDVSSRGAVANFGNIIVEAATDPSTSSGVITVEGKLSVESTGTLTDAGSVVIGQKPLVTFASNGGKGENGSNAQVKQTGSLDVSGNVQVASTGQLLIFGRATIESGGSVDVSGSLNVGLFPIDFIFDSDDAVLNVAGNLTIDQSGTFTDNANVRIEGGNSSAGTSPGSLFIFGTANIGGNLQDDGTMWLGFIFGPVPNASLTVSGNMAIGKNGSLWVFSGTSISVSGNLSDCGQIIGFPFLIFSPSTPPTVDVTGNMTIGKDGSLEMASGSLTVESTGTLTDAGNILIGAKTDPNSGTTSPATFDVLGNVNVTSSGSLDVSGAVTVESSATLSDSGAVTLTNTTDSNGTVLLRANLDIAGNLNIGRHGSLETDGDVKVEASGLVTSKGSITVDADGFLDIFGTVRSEKPTGSLTVNGTETVEPGGHLYA